MVSIYKIENTWVKPEGDYISVELRGLSTDEMPIEINDKKVDNGSTYLCVDTGDLYIYDLESQEWNKI